MKIGSYKLDPSTAAIFMRRPVEARHVRVQRGKSWVLGLLESIDSGGMAVVRRMDGKRPIVIQIDQVWII